jgi:hypothetical protein
MPRFSYESINILKGAMLPRLPECIFFQADYADIMQRTGLSKAQIEFWEEHVRQRNSSVEERVEFLRNQTGFKVRLRGGGG